MERLRSGARGVEPDECYSIGEAGDVPDVALEVIWTSGGLNKLEHGEIILYPLRGDRYEPIPKSEYLPQIDQALVSRLLNEPSSQSAAVRELRRVLRER